MMYLLIGIFCVVCILFACLQFFRRKRILCKVAQMDAGEKACLLDDILKPLGFCYNGKQDIITSTKDAWQRQFGYCSLYDRTAVHFGMALDCEPIYFYYRGCTYRVELWKGQYGINMGAEAGIYYAEGILPPQEFDNAHFQSVSDEDMLMVEMSLYDKGQKVFENEGQHWWLTGFRVCNYCEPENLVLRVAITCKDYKIASRLAKSLLHMGYDECGIVVCDLTVCFTFGAAHSRQPRHGWQLRTAWAQWKNRLLTRLICRITKPFACTPDRLVYLYFFLPSAFRRICRCRKNRRQKYRGR